MDSNLAETKPPIETTTTTTKTEPFTGEIPFPEEDIKPFLTTTSQPSLITNSQSLLITNARSDSLRKFHRLKHIDNSHTQMPDKLEDEIHEATMSFGRILPETESSATMPSGTMSSEIVPIRAKSSNTVVVKPVAQIKTEAIESSSLFISYSKQQQQQQQQLYKCRYCPSLFKAGDLQRHELSEHLNTFKCSKCSMSFGTRSVLKMHEDLHSLSRGYLCPRCGIEFSTTLGRDFHMRSHKETSKQQQQQQQQPELPPALQPKLEQELQPEQYQAKDLQLKEQATSGLTCPPCMVVFASVQAKDDHVKLFHNEQQQQEEDIELQLKANQNLVWHKKQLVAAKRRRETEQHKLRLKQQQLRKQQRPSKFHCRQCFDGFDEEVQMKEHEYKNHPELRKEYEPQNKRKEQQQPQQPHYVPIFEIL